MKQFFFTILFSLNICSLLAQIDNVAVNSNDSLFIYGDLKPGKTNFWKYAGNSANGFLFGISYDFMNFPNDRLLQDKWGISVTSKVIAMPFLFDVCTSLHSFDRSIKGYSISPAVSFCPVPFLPLKPQTQANLSKRFYPYLGIGYNLYIERIKYPDYYQTQWTEYGEHTYTKWTYNYQDSYTIHSLLCKVGMIYSIKKISVIAEYEYCFNSNRANNHQYFSIGLAIKSEFVAASRKPKKVFDNNPVFLK
jgi:hypothetical protein